MSEQGTTKDQVSLDDLKRAIEQYELIRSTVVAAIDVFHPLQLARDTEQARADAWRTAYGWLETTTCDDLYGDLQEGQALIKEKIR